MNHMQSGVINYQENLTPKSFLPINNKIYVYILNQKTPTPDWLSPNFFQLITGIV